MQEIDRMLHHRTRARFWNWGLPVRYRFGQDYTGTTPRPGRAIPCSESPGPVAPPSARAHFTLSARALASSSSVYCQRGERGSNAEWLQAIEDTAD